MQIIDSLRDLLEPLSARGGAISPEIQILSTIRYLCKGNYQSESGMYSIKLILM